MLPAPARRVAAILVLTAAVGALVLSPAAAQRAPWAVDRGGNALGLALRRPGVTGRVLSVTAHPDDESNGVLVRLSRGLGLRTALLTLTRGEGGQNAIGPEFRDALGILRTEELMAVHRFDGVEQYFGRAYEFGFSYDADETLEKWGREETLGDVVRVVRTFRPDVILTLPQNGKDHQHHTVSARLAREAFRAAADPKRFPEQVEAGLRPWQTARIYEGGVGGAPREGERTPVRLATGVLDPLLGMSARQFGTVARANHRSQGSRQMEDDPGAFEATFLLVDSEPKAEAGSELLDGIDVSLQGLLRFTKGPEEPSAFLAPDLATIDGRLQEARAVYDPRNPEKAVPALGRALAAVRKAWDDVAQSRLTEAEREELLGRLDDQERAVTDALILAQGIAFEARLDPGRVAPGGDVGVTVTVWNQGASSVSLEDVGLEVQAGWPATRVEGEPRSLEGGQSARVLYKVAVPASARLSGPYWHRGAHKDRHETDAPAMETLPWSAPDVAASARIRFADVSLRLLTPAVFRYPGSAGGEKQHVLEVVPRLSVRLTPDVLVFPLARRGSKEVRVNVANEGGEASDTVVRLHGPAGFDVEPKEASVHLARRGDEATVRFQVTPPAGRSAGTAVLGARAILGGVEYGETLQEIDYPHVHARVRRIPAEATLLTLDVATGRGLDVGYVMGSGDAVPEAVAQLGLPLTLLDADDLAFADLGRFSTIVIGVRAYETRADLRSAHERLMRFVEAGGHLLVQYHRAAFNGGGTAEKPAPSPYAPWPASVSSRRLTDETAPLEVLVPASPVFTSPNRIAPADWSGWVQERAIQLLDAKDPRYVELLAGADPFPLNPSTQKGILVETKVGKGTWTYTGLVLFRQLPAANPGAYRLLANLLSRPRAR